MSANYLEALERWDTGAIQCFCAQALFRSWFWAMLGWMLTLMISMVAPAWVPLHALDHGLGGLGAAITSSPSEHAGLAVLMACACLWIIFVVTSVMLLYWSPAHINSVLRRTIIFFNVTYPFNSISSVFWVVIPPWICMTGKFPFSFSPVFAIAGRARAPRASLASLPSPSLASPPHRRPRGAGSLVLRLVEWMIVLKTKKESLRNGTQLREYSIFRSQQAPPPPPVHAWIAHPLSTPASHALSFAPRR